MDGRRTALIIASDDYDHPGLSRLRAPAADAQALANVLGDKEVGDFRVQIVHNAPNYIVQGHIEDLFADSQSDDLVLLHFSGHGLKSDSGELFFATRNTRPDRLASTAVPADFVQRCMRTSRARSIVLFLDCCYGGAFGQGVAVRAAGSANVLESFPAGRLGGGRGRAVITASSAMEYAFEGNSLADEHQSQPSVFTAALVDGLSSGEADRDEDGLVSLNELYDYVFDKVREQNPKQTPSRDVELQGELYLARSQRRRLRALPIPGEVAAALKDQNMFTRLGAVAELRSRMSSTDLGAALGAYEALRDVVRSDIKYVQDAAADVLAGALPVASPAELEFGSVTEGQIPLTRTVRLGGPPLARMVKVSASDPWVLATAEPDGVQVTLDPSQIGTLSGSVTLTAPTGQVVVPVTADVVSAPAEAAPGHPAPLETGPVISEQSTTETKAESVKGEEPTNAGEPTEGEQPSATSAAAMEPVVAPSVAGPAAVEARPVQPVGTKTAPVAGIPAAAGRQGEPSAVRPDRPLWKLSGVVALASAGLMLLSVLLPIQSGTPTYSTNPPTTAIYLLALAIVVLTEGVLTLGTRRRIQGLGAIMGSAAVGTLLLPDLVNTVLYELGTSDLSLGLWVGLLSAVVLIAAGIYALRAVRREAELGFAPPLSSDWATWLVLVLAVASSLLLLPPTLDEYPSRNGWVAEGLWGSVLAVAVPLTGLLLRPVPLGRSMLVGWALAGVGPVLAIWIRSDEHYDKSNAMWFVILILVGIAGLARFIHRAGGRTPHHTQPETRGVGAGP